MWLGFAKGRNASGHGYVPAPDVPTLPRTRDEVGASPLRLA